MSAVYVVRNGKPWWSDLAGTAANALLSNFIKGAMDRDQYAREKNRFNKEWSAYQDSLGGQGEASAPITMGVQSSPETRRLSQAITGATGMTQNTDALGLAPQAPQVDLSSVPEQYRPAPGDGLVTLAAKAQYAPRTITRANAYGNLGRMMSRNNIDTAIKLLEGQYGNQFKVDDQLYKGRALTNELGTVPDMMNKQAQLDYFTRAGLYGEGDTATRGLNFDNSEYQRRYGESEAAKQRAFAEAQQRRQFANQWGLAKYNNAQQNYRAQLSQAARAAAGGNGTGNANIAKLAAPYEKMLAKTGGDDLENYDWANFQDAVRRQYQDNPEMGEAILQYLSANKNLLAAGEGEDMLTTTPTKPNPFAGRYKPLTPAYMPGSITIQGGTPQRVTYDALGLSGAGAPGGIPAPSAPAATGAPTAGTGAIPRSAVEAFMKQTGITDYKTAEAALMRGIQNY